MAFIQLTIQSTHQFYSVRTRPRQPYHRPLIYLQRVTRRQSRNFNQVGSRRSLSLLVSKSQSIFTLQSKKTRLIYLVLLRRISAAQQCYQLLGQSLYRLTQVRIQVVKIARRYLLARAIRQKSLQALYPVTSAILLRQLALLARIGNATRRGQIQAIVYYYANLRNQRSSIAKISVLSLERSGLVQPSPGVKIGVKGLGYIIIGQRRDVRSLFIVQ